MATTADFWSTGVNDDNVIGGPARILVADKATVAYPNLIRDVINLETYEAQTGWFDVGHTSEPFVNTEGFDTTEWESQQSGIINLQVGNWNRNISFTLMESRRDKVADLVHEATGRTTNADGDELEYFYDKSNVTEWRVAAINLMEDETAGQNLTMDVFPRCKRSGADSEMSWSRSEPQTHTLEMRPFPDTAVPNDASWYRISET